MRRLQRKVCAPALATSRTLLHVGQKLVPCGVEAFSVVAGALADKLDAALELEEAELALEAELVI